MHSFGNLIQNLRLAPEVPAEFGSLSGVSSNLSAKFFDRSAIVLARELLGRILVSRCGGVETSGVIVETQAYTGIKTDPDSHIYRGHSSRTADWKAGSLYVYSVQGQTMTTVATPPYHEGAAVLIRALEPKSGLAEMQARIREDVRLFPTQGPGRLSAALGITTVLNGSNIFESNYLQIEPGSEIAETSIIQAPRVNTKDPSKLLRFYIADSKWVTGKK